MNLPAHESKELMVRFAEGWQELLGSRPGNEGIQSRADVHSVAACMQVSMPLTRLLTMSPVPPLGMPHVIRQPCGSCCQPTWCDTRMRLAPCDTHSCLWLQSELHEARRYMLYCRGLKHKRPEMQRRFWVENLGIGACRTVHRPPQCCCCIAHNPPCTTARMFLPQCESPAHTERCWTRLCRLLMHSHIPIPRCLVSTHPLCPSIPSAVAAWQR